MKRLQALLLSCMLAAPVLAQGAPPGFIVKPQPSWMLINSLTSVPGTDIRSVHHLRLSNDAAGVWTTCLTVNALPSYLGGDDKSVGVLIGHFNPYQGTFTLTLEAKALNSTSDDGYLSLDPSGLYAIFERGSSIMLASRTSVGTAFGAPKVISGFGSNNMPTPSLGVVGGKVVCFYSDQITIYWCPIDLVNAIVDPVKRVAVTGATGSAGAFAPRPIHGADGEVEAILFAQKVSSVDSDQVWADDLDPTTPPEVLVDTPDWTNHDSPAGGFISFAHNILPRWHLMHSETAWLVGDVEPVGGTVDILCAAVNPKPNQVVTVVFGSAKRIARTPIPPFQGFFGVDPATFVLLGAVVHPDLEGLATLSFPVPNNPTLKGVDMVVQGLAVDSVRQLMTFTSTGLVSIR
ncbi:MAG: hypothetical protein R3F30_06950 [Planctomycetota bacterium]